MGRHATRAQAWRAVADRGPGLAGVAVADMVPHLAGDRREDREIHAAVAHGLQLGAFQALADFVVAQGWKLLELRTQETSLEETYLRVVSTEGGPH